MNAYIFKCTDSNEQLIYDDFNSYFTCSYERRNNKNIYIGPHIYHQEAIIEEIDTIIGQIQREWFHFQSIALYDNILQSKEMLYSREIINYSFSSIKGSLQICSCPQRKERYQKKTVAALKCILNSIISLTNIRNDFVVKLSSWTDSDVKNPVYQYFHVFLEMQYYLLFLSHMSGASESDINEIVENIISNFIQLSKTNFQRQTGKVFVCPCMKRFWVLIQIFLERTKIDSDSFWKLFNKTVEHEDSMFSLWILTEIAELQLLNENFVFEGNDCARIRTNYDLLHSKLKVLLQSADSDLLLKLFRTINPLLTNYWLKNAKVEVNQIIWDFYSKRLNISKKNYANLSAVEFNLVVNDIISSPDQCNEDFEIFTGILISHLKEYPSHWGKMKGRIYSQLGPQKLRDLNEVGVVHIMFLFTTLSTINYEELLKKITSLLEGLNQEKRNSAVIWNISIAFIIMQVKRGLSIEKTGLILLPWIQETSLHHKHFYLLKSFLISFEHILNFSNNLQLYQWLFLNSWLTKYFSACYHADMVGGFEILLRILQKVENPDSWSSWSQSFRDHVYPILKQATLMYNAPGSVGTIAGKLYLLSPYNQTEIFNNFNNDNVPVRIGLNFLITALGDNTCITPQQEVSVIQTWFKVCLIFPEPCGSLTNIVTKLDYFPETLKLHLNSSEDPIRAMIEYLGSDIKTHVKSNIINKLCDICFGNIHKWLPQFFVQPECESVVLKLYVCLSLALLHCGPLLYHRNRSSSPLTKVMQCLLLSSDFLIGKTPHEYVLNSIKKTWHIFYEALVKLKDDSDMYLERTLRDMITKYVQHFSTADTPFSKCLENDVTAEVVLEKISNSYFKHPVKESDNNLQKVVKILGDTIQSTTSVTLLKLVITKTVCGLFELVIFHPQRNLGINLIKLITLSPLYPQVSADFLNCVILTTERHLGFNAVNYFQMMYIVAKFVPHDINTVIGKISQQVGTVERLRGVGYDISLRSQLEKLENIVK